MHGISENLLAPWFQAADTTANKYVQSSIGFNCGRNELSPALTDTLATAKLRSTIVWSTLLQANLNNQFIPVRTDEE